MGGDVVYSVFQLNSENLYAVNKYFLSIKLPVI